MTTAHSEQHDWKHFPNAKPPKKRCQKCGILVAEIAKRKDIGPCPGSNHDKDISATT